MVKDIAKILFLLTLAGCVGDNAFTGTVCPPIASPSSKEGCKRFSSEEEALLIVQQFHSAEFEKAKAATGDFEEVIITALLAQEADKREYCLSVFGGSPSARVYSSLTENGHKLKACGSNTPSSAVNGLQKLGEEKYRVHISGHCGVGGLCGGASWFYVEKINGSYKVTNVELQWIS